MNVKRLIYRLLSVVEKETTPRDWALGFAMGAWLGWSFGLNLQTVFGFLVITCLRGNLIGVVLSFAATLVLRDFSHDAASAIGYWILTHGASFRRLWAAIYHAPLIPYTFFYETVTMGRLVLGALGAASFFLFGYFWIGPRRNKLFLKIIDGPIGYSWQHSSLRHGYVVFISQFGHPAHSSSLLRRRAPWFISGGTAILMLGFYLAIPWLLESALTRYLTLVNNAPVTLGDVTLSLIKGELTIKDVAVTHHVQPTKNLLFVDQITAKFEVLPLLNKKVLFRKVAISGIQLDVAKPSRAEADANLAPLEFQTPNVMDRVAAQFFNEARSEIKNNPFRYVVALQKGVDLTSLLRHEKGLLHSQNELNRIVADTETLRAQCQQLSETQCKQDWEAMSRRYRAADSLIKSDVDRIKQQLGFSQSNTMDLSKALLGPRILQWLDRLGYWMDLSRRRMAVSQDPLTYTMMVENTGSTTMVHFGKRSTVPSLLIEEVTVDSKAAPHSAYGNVVGSLKGITNAPAVYGRPTEGTIEFDFPERGYKKTRATVFIDHTGNANEERFTLESEEMPLNTWAFYQASELYLGLEKALASLKVEFSAREDVLLATGRLNVRPLSFAIRSPYRQLQSQLQTVFANNEPFALTFEVSGLPSAARLDLKSPFGVKVANALKEEFRQTQAAVEENVRREVEDTLAGLRRTLIARLGVSYSNFSDSFRKTASVK